MMAFPMFTDLDQIHGENLQTRVALDEQTVLDYAELYREDETTLPPVEVMQVSATGEILLTDGFHRLEAARRAGRTRIRCNFSFGSLNDALRAALRANAAHGLRRTNADKRKALKMAWEHRHQLFGGDPSHDVLAEACGVSKKTVKRFRKDIAGGDNDPTCRRIGMDGKRYSAAKRPPSRGVLLDGAGQPVPERLAPAFRAREFLKLVNKMTRLANEIAALKATGTSYELAYAEQSDLVGISDAIRRLRQARPYAVCPACSGEGCRECRNLGFLPKDKFIALTREIEHAGGLERLNNLNTINSINTDRNNSNSSSNNNTNGQNGEEVR